MNQAKYIGMDVHQATISVAVMDSTGKLILERQELVALCRNGSVIIWDGADAIKQVDQFPGFSLK